MKIFGMILEYHIAELISKTCTNIWMFIGFSVISYVFHYCSNKYKNQSRFRMKIKIMPIMFYDRYT